MAGEDIAAQLGQFLEWKAAQDAAAAADNDPDNERDVAFTGPDGSSITLPWRKAREYDIESMLESKFGLKRKAAAAAGGDDGSTGKGTGKGKPAASGQAPAAGGGAAVANLFRKQAGQQQQAAGS